MSSFASSYIPTTTASVTRNADVLSYPTAGNMLPSMGSLYAEISRVNLTDNVSIIDTSENPADISKPMINLYSGPNGSGRGIVIANGSIQGNFNFGTTSINTRTKSAFRYSTNSLQGYLNGTKATEVTSAIMNVAIPSSIVSIGLRNNNSLPLFGTIRNVKIWKKALTDTQLINLTT